MPFSHPGSVAKSVDTELELGGTDAGDALVAQSPLQHARRRWPPGSLRVQQSQGW